MEKILSLLSSISIALLLLFYCVNQTCYRSLRHTKITLLQLILFHFYDSLTFTSLLLTSFNVWWGIQGKLTEIHTVMIITHNNSLMSTICLSPPHHSTPREGCDFMVKQCLLKIMLLPEMTISLYHKLWQYERSSHLVCQISLLIYLKTFRYFQGWAMLRERRLQCVSMSHWLQCEVLSHPRSIMTKPEGRWLT